MKPYCCKGNCIKGYLENTKCCWKKSSACEESIPNQSRDKMLTKLVAGGSAPWTPEYRLPQHPLVSSHGVKWAPGRKSSVHTHTQGIFCTPYFLCINLSPPKLGVAPWPSRQRLCLSRGWSRPSNPTWPRPPSGEQQPVSPRLSIHWLPIQNAFSTQCCFPDSSSNGVCTSWLPNWYWLRHPAIALFEIF